MVKQLQKNSKAASKIQENGLYDPDNGQNDPLRGPIVWTLCMEYKRQIFREFNEETVLVRGLFAIRNNCV